MEYQYIGKGKLFDSALNFLIHDAVPIIFG